MPAREKKGFTLFELLVATSITSLLFGLGVARYQAFNRRQVLAQATKTLKNNLRLAQEKALANEKPAGFCAAYALAGYRLQFNSDSSYLIEAVCDDDDKTTQTVKTYFLPGNVTGVAGEKVLFKVLGQGVDMEGQTEITFTLTGAGGTQNVTVTRTGKIE